MASPYIVMDMTTTRPEFFRCLNIALRGLSTKIDGDNIEAIVADKVVIMSLAPLPPRALSQTLKLERWELTIVFNGQSEPQRTGFMKTFNQAFHRGGG